MEILIIVFDVLLLFLTFRFIYVPRLIENPIILFFLVSFIIYEPIDWFINWKTKRIFKNKSDNVNNLINYGKYVWKLSGNVGMYLVGIGGLSMLSFAVIFGPYIGLCDFREGANQQGLLIQSNFSLTNIVSKNSKESKQIKRIDAYKIIAKEHDITNIVEKAYESSSSMLGLDYIISQKNDFNIVEKEKFKKLQEHFLYDMLLLEDKDSGYEWVDVSDEIVGYYNPIEWDKKHGYLLPKDKVMFIRLRSKSKIFNDYVYYTLKYDDINSKYSIYGWTVIIDNKKYIASILNNSSAFNEMSVSNKMHEVDFKIFFEHMHKNIEATIQSMK